MTRPLTTNIIELEPFARSVLLVLLRRWGTPIDVQDIMHDLIGMGWEHDNAMPDRVRLALVDLEDAIAR